MVLLIKSELSHGKIVSSLYEVQDGTIVGEPLKVISRKLNRPERNLSRTRQEAIAVFWSIRNFTRYIRKNPWDIIFPFKISKILVDPFAQFIPSRLSLNYISSFLKLLKLLAIRVNIPRFPYSGSDIKCSHSNRLIPRT